jgi:hypothetical protein
MITAFDWDAGVVRLLAVLPEELDGWTAWPMRAGAPVVIVEVPTAAPDAGSTALMLDSGDPSGLALPRAEWLRQAARAGAKRWTVKGSYAPGRGFAADLERWAEDFELGGLTVPGLPVRSTSHPIMATWRLDAVGGLLAMSCFDMIVDGPRERVWLRPRKKPGLPWDYNRLGAAFIPKSLNEPELVATVGLGTPAAEAGIEDGDLLLAIGDLDVTKWQTNPTVLPLSRFWAQPAGTELRLRLSRDGKPYRVRVTLRELFQPVSKASDKQKNG